MVWDDGGFIADSKEEAEHFAGYFVNHEAFPLYARPATPTNPERLVDWRGHCEWLLDLDEIHVGEGETDVLARIASIRAALSAAPLKDPE